MVKIIPDSCDLSMFILAIVLTIVILIITYLVMSIDLEYNFNNDSN